MTEKTGGLKLKHPQHVGVMPIINMIDYEHSEINLFSASSLYGFIFTLNVDDPKVAEYLNLGDHAFTETVTNYVLKFTIIAPVNGIKLPRYNDSKKETESPETFYNEAKIQQDAWVRSITGARPAICPSIANFSLFHKEDALIMLQFLLSKQLVSDEAKDAFIYIYNELHSYPERDLGLIVMPTISKSITLSTYMREPNPLKLQMISQLTANTIRLFVDIGIIHFDLHSSNALVYRNKKGEDQCIIIDFGRATDVSELRDDPYLSEKVKEYILVSRNNMLLDLVEKTQWTKEEKAAYIVSVMKYLTKMDNAINSHLFPNYYVNHPGEYQMSWYDAIKNNIDELALSFDILVDSMKMNKTHLTQKTINNYIKKGNFVDLDQPIETYYQTCHIPNA